MIGIIGSYIALAIGWIIFSYGFKDSGLTLSTNALVVQIQQPLTHLIYYERWATGVVYIIGLIALTALYFVMRRKVIETSGYIKVCIVVLSLMGIVAFPALSYDVFNYMTTAKVAFTHKENPYIVMPIDIPNEPNLSFTRAANKVALYGPIWIGISALPHALGQGNTWMTILAFKWVAVASYLMLIYLVWKMTKKWENVIFFAFNPLIIMELLIAGHNDGVMMVLAICGMYIYWSKNKWNKWMGLLVLGLSSLVKGSTVVLLPLFIYPWREKETMIKIAFWLMLGVFVIAAPIREELYPWYFVWAISIASLVDIKKEKFMSGLVIIMSIALELRHVPYMMMGYYEGYGPVYRILLTAIPIAGYLIYYAIKNHAKILHNILNTCPQSLHESVGRRARY